MEEANRAAKERARRAAEARAREEEDPYGPCYAVAAEGARIGLLTCKQCGACILLGSEVDSMAVHTKWHEKLRHKKLLRGGKR